MEKDNLIGREALYDEESYKRAEQAEEAGTVRVTHHSKVSVVGKRVLHGVAVAVERTEEVVEEVIDSPPVFKDRPEDSERHD